MTLFFILAAIASIILLYSLFNSFKDLLHSKKEYQNTISLQKYSNLLKDNTKPNGILLTEISEIKNHYAREVLLKDFPMATYMFTGITGRGKYVNTAFEKLLGYSLKEVPTIYKCMQVIFPDKNYRRYIKNELKKICNEGKKTKSIFRSIEVYVSCKDGSKKCISMGCISKGNLKWFYSFDLTSSKKKEKLILNGEHQLKEQNTHKDKVFSIIAHDLRSPFNTILACSDLLLENIKEIEKEEALRFTKIIKTTAENSLSLLDNLLNWSKLQTEQSNLNPQKIIISRVINEIMELYSSAAASKDIELDYHRSDDFEICTDLNMLKTILRNIVSNSIKFTRIGGKISIGVKKEQRRFEIAIVDNGIGISERNKNKLFRIQTNKWTPGTSDEKGSGLGLPLCKELIEKLGGRISLESKESLGSEFKLILPLTFENVGGLKNDKLVESS